MRDFLILLVMVGSGVCVWGPRLARKVCWRATITQLASTIGGGSLVLGPVLIKSLGRAAPLAMAALCLGAYAFGSAVRFNIRRIEDVGLKRSRFRIAHRSGASWALALSYIVSVAYYVKLFGTLGMSLSPWPDRTHAQWLTSAVLPLILAVGWTRGSRALERTEQLAVSAKLAIIAGSRARGLVGRCTCPSVRHCTTWCSIHPA